jgi:protein-disulfide isomerase
MTADAPSSKKGLLLLTPAILLVGATLAVGQSEPPPAAPVAKTEAAALSAPATAKSEAAAPEKSEPSAKTEAAAKVEAAPATQKTAAAQRKEIENIVREYLLNNPEVLMEAQSALEAKMDKIQAERTAAMIKSNAKEIYRPAASPVVGNAKGDVTVLEFFDYNCGYCKRAFKDVAGLVENDKQVKVILKEFPILNKGSEEAAKVALAAKLQGKYWEFHRAMLESQGQASEAAALRVAEKVGVDMARLKKDMGSAEVKKEIDDTRALAQKLGIQGTPHFLVGDRIIPGAPENLLEQMTKLVADVRKEGCKVC